jgi:hypothetical protein
VWRSDCSTIDFGQNLLYRMHGEIKSCVARRGIYKCNKVRTCTARAWKGSWSSAWSFIITFVVAPRELGPNLPLTLPWHSSPSADLYQLTPGRYFRLYYENINVSVAGSKCPLVAQRTTYLCHLCCASLTSSTKLSFHLQYFLVYFK